jgi:hypothetical protein
MLVCSPTVIVLSSFLLFFIFLGVVNQQRLSGALKLMQESEQLLKYMLEYLQQSLCSICVGLRMCSPMRVATLPTSVISTTIAATKTICADWNQSQFPSYLAIPIPKVSQPLHSRPTKAITVCSCPPSQKVGPTSSNWRGLPCERRRWGTHCAAPVDFLACIRPREPLHHRAQSLGFRINAASLSVQSIQISMEALSSKSSKSNVLTSRIRVRGNSRDAGNSMQAASEEKNIAAGPVKFMQAASEEKGNAEDSGKFTQAASEEKYIKTISQSITKGISKKPASTKNNTRLVCKLDGRKSADCCADACSCYRSQENIMCDDIAISPEDAIQWAFLNSFQSTLSSLQLPEYSLIVRI